MLPRHGLSGQSAAALKTKIKKKSNVSVCFMLNRRLKRPRILDRLAQIETNTGQSEEAIATLQQLLTMPAGECISIARLKVDPVWDPIRNNPEFPKLHSEPEPETIYK
jgi:hypothetical protein